MKKISALLMVAFLIISGGLKAQVLINEIMAANSHTIQDEFGGYPDWIELRNLTDQPIDIGGWYITDSIPDLTKFMIKVTQPDSTTIPANGFLVLWADSKKSQGVRHVDFKLSKSGEQVALSKMIGGVLTIVDSVTFPEQISDISYGRERGTNKWMYMNTPTPGAANLPLDVPMMKQLSDLQVWPNPAHGSVSLKGETTSSSEIRLINMLGQTVLSRVFDAGNLKTGISLDIQSVKPGFYLIYLLSDNLVQKTELLVQ